VRWGIVGLGRIASGFIAPAIATSQTNELISVVSRDQAKADAFAREHGARRGTTDYRAMLEDPEVDAVYIATPNALHAAQVIAAAEAGKHVLCDKPLATSVADARQAADACRDHGVRLGITFQTRFHDGVAQARQLVSDGAIGTPVVAQVQISAGRKLPVSWRLDPALAGLGTINNLGVHGLDVLGYILGDQVTEVTALTHIEPGYRVDTTALILLRFAGGALGYLNANQSVAYPQDDIAIYGTTGRVFLRNLSRPAREGTVSVTVPSGETEARGSSRDAYQRVIEAFATAVMEEREPSPSGEDGVRSVELTAAIAQALHERRVVSLLCPSSSLRPSTGSRWPGSCSSCPAGSR
jgi:1,5-anhydro-D-fructose reductase (1,5-anhydro-D-mannitol-forming)